jgi:uncharacterized protein YciI
MAYAVLAFDGEDEGAPARRLAARPRHLAVLTRWIEEGRLAFGAPLVVGAEARMIGSLMVINGEEPQVLADYLAEEPFSTDGVWVRKTTWPFRIAPLPYAPVPVAKPDEQVAAVRTHTAVIAFDGTDPEAPARRQEARPAHLDRVRPMAANGTLTLGGALLDPAGERMIGSIVVTRHDTDAAARAWLAEDPYTKAGVWRDATVYGLRFAAMLPWRPLPGSPA